MPASKSKHRFAMIVSLFTLSPFALCGCGGGSGASGGGGGAFPAVSLSGRAAVTSTPSNIEEVGGVATYTLDIDPGVQVDPTSVLINVHNGATLTAFPNSDATTAIYQSTVATLIQSKDRSLTDGPQVMSPVAGVKNRFTYQFNFPAPNGLYAAGVYFAYYTAKDTKGNLIIIPVTNGTNEDRTFKGNLTLVPPSIQ